MVQITRRHTPDPPFPPVLTDTSLLTPLGLKNRKQYTIAASATRDRPGSCWCCCWGVDDTLVLPRMDMYGNRGQDDDITCTTACSRYMGG